MTDARRLQAEVRYSNAQLDEQRAREAHNQAGIDRAKAEQEAAQNELYALTEAARTNASEERVTLVCPNPEANLTDAAGVTFVDGRAEGVRVSVARKYLEDFDGYQVEKE
jgi:GTP cyclohydrolase FolE2